MLQPVFTACCDESYFRVRQYILSCPTICTIVIDNMYFRQTGVSTACSAFINIVLIDSKIPLSILRFPYVCFRGDAS